MSKKVKKRIVAGALVAGGTVAAANAAGRNSGEIKARAKKVRKAAVKKAEGNQKVRQEVASRLLAERRAQTRAPRKGLKMDKKYRMGRPEVRKKRKAAKYG
jgi:hypothetical protein